MASASDPGTFLTSPLVFDPSAIFSPSSPTFPLTKLYTPIHIRKHATYIPHPAGHITTIQASWGPMTMHGSHYLVEDSGTDTPGVYGSTVEAWRETNRLVDGDVEGRGVWVKTGVVRAVQVADEYNVNKVSRANKADKRIRFSDPGGAAEITAGINNDDVVRDDNGKAITAVTIAASPPLSVPMPGMLVLTYHNGKVETERILEAGDWVVRQESSAQKEVMVLSDENFKARYTEMREMDE